MTLACGPKRCWLTRTTTKSVCCLEPIVPKSTTIRRDPVLLKKGLDVFLDLTLANSVPGRHLDASASSMNREIDDRRKTL